MIGLFLVLLAQATVEGKSPSPIRVTPSLPPYQCTGTGCVARTIPSKLGDVVSLKDYCATIDGSTDNTSCIQNAVNSLSSVPGTIMGVPGATYKINSTVTVPIGISFDWNGSQLDITSNTGVVFDYNSGAGAMDFLTAATLFQRAKVTGAIGNTSTYLVQTYRMPYFTMRDVVVKYSNVAKIIGEGVLSKFDRVTAYFPVGSVFLIQKGAGAFGANFAILDHVYVERAQNANAVGVQIDYGDITIQNSYFEEIPVSIWVNGGAVAVYNSSINTTGTDGQTMIKIDGIIKDPAVIVDGCYLSFGENIDVTRKSYGITSSVANAAVVVTGSAFADISSVSAPATIFRVTGTGSLVGVVNGNRFYANAQAVQQLFTIFDPNGISSGMAYMEVTGNTFWADTGGTPAQIDFTKAGATGSLSQLIVTGNNFLRAGNLLRLDGGKVDNNNFQGLATTITWSGTAGTLIGNTYGVSSTITNAASQAIETGVAADGSGFKHKRGTAGCNTGGVCTTTITWTTAFADANYTATCIGNGVTAGVPGLGAITSKIAASVTVQTVALTAAAAQFTVIDCAAVHD